MSIITSVVCVIQTMSASRVDTYVHQRVEEHKWSTIGYHVKDELGGDPESIGNNFEILKKCLSKLDCLIFEMFFIRKLIINENWTNRLDLREVIYLAFFYYSRRNFFVCFVSM